MLQRQQSQQTVRIQTDTNLNNKYLNQRPQHSSSTSPPIEVKDNDVLCGRGGLANKHRGNLLYRQLVNANKDLYQSCGKKKNHKYFLAISIIEAVEIQGGGRFLRRDDKLGDWVTISREDAFSKTSQALREYDGRSKKSSEAVERVVEKKKHQKQRRAQHQQVQKSSDAKGRDETAGHSVPTISNQESSDDAHQRKDRNQRRRAPAAPHGYDTSLDFSARNTATLSTTRTDDVGIPAYDDEIVDAIELDEITAMEKQDLPAVDSSRHSFSSEDTTFTTCRPTSISERTTSWERMVVFPDDLDDFFLNNDVLLEGFATFADP
jgi:hypothetical protein